MDKETSNGIKEHSQRIEVDLSYFRFPPLSPLPFPTSLDEFNERCNDYEKDKDLRRKQYAKRTVSGFFQARTLYYHALHSLTFVLEGFDRLKGIKPDLDLREYIYMMKRLNICLRKIAGCCYYLDRSNEGWTMAKANLRIVDGYRLNEKFKKLTLFFMSLMSITEREFQKSRDYLNKARELDYKEKVSFYLKHAMVILEKHSNGEECLDEHCREEVWKGFDESSYVALLVKRGDRMGHEDMEERICFLKENVEVFTFSEAERRSVFVTIKRKNCRTFYCLRILL